MPKPRPGKPVGILNPQAGERNFRLARYLPSSDLAPFIEHYWAVSWDLRGRPPYTSENIPHPSIHLVIEPRKAEVVGVMRHKFVRVLKDKGQVFGIKFRPGAFYLFVQSPVSRLTDTTHPLSSFFGPRGRALIKSLRATTDAEEQIEAAEDFLRTLAPQPDSTTLLLNQIIDRIIAGREILKVEDLVRKFNLSARSLQRLFSLRVGVSPKWVIRRYRLHDAADQLSAGRVVNWPKLAVDLGYFDQAHFIKDFKALVGLSPAEYARQVESN